MRPVAHRNDSQRLAARRYAAKQREIRFAGQVPKRCQCEKPFVVDEEGWVRCLLCCREPRL